MDITPPVQATLSTGAMLGLLTLLEPAFATPSKLVPCSFPLIFILFVTHVNIGILACLVAGAFWSWSWFLFRGQSRVPLRTVIAFAAAAILSLVHFVSFWRRGIEFSPGPILTVCYAILDGLCVAGLAFLLLRARQRPSFPRNLTLHALLFVWLITYAFPYLMEWP
ncbi:MAG: hypothetical protein P4L84_13670 [Isosphaeraceae bacterium]|nr:hypothetical protein [Isosphaeraceae bacterium]